MAHVSFISLLIDVAAMMLIIGPTTLLLLWCIWRYRRSAGDGAYRPGWVHSLPIEIVSWGFPLAIVAFLSLMSYRSSFLTNPFGPGALERVSGGGGKPVDVEVVTTDWQWLFIYPGLHVASANELVVPVRTPVRLRMTSVTVSNDIFIPQLVGQIDVMPGMLTRQSFSANTPGTYQGIATDFNGPGFAWMQFQAKVVSEADFARWSSMAAQSPSHLDYAAFVKFAAPTIDKDGTVTLFSQVDDKLFGRIINATMAGTTYATPSEMTAKKASQHNNRQQMNHSPPAAKSTNESAPS